MNNAEALFTTHRHKNLKKQQQQQQKPNKQTNQKK